MFSSALFAKWETLHPYNGAQILKIRGTVDAALCRKAWLDALKSLKSRGGFASPKPPITIAASTARPCSTGGFVSRRKRDLKIG